MSPMSLSKYKHCKQNGIHPSCLSLFPIKLTYREIKTCERNTQFAFYSLHKILSMYAVLKLFHLTIYPEDYFMSVCIKLFHSS